MNNAIRVITNLLCVLIWCAVMVKGDNIGCGGSVGISTIGSMKEIDNQTYFQIVSSNETILAVSWKETSSSITTAKSFFENRRIILYYPNADVYTVSDYRRKVLESSFNTVLDMYNISTVSSSSTTTTVTSILPAVRIQSDCVFGNVLLDYWSQSPIILTTDSDLPKILRLIRVNNKLGRYLEMDDLNIVRLAPLYFSYSTSLDSEKLNLCLADEFRNFTSNCEVLIGACNEELRGKDSSYRSRCYLAHDYCVLRSGKISLSKTSFEYNDFEKYLGKLYPKGSIYVNETLSNSVSSFNSTSFLSSSVFECSTSSCTYDPVKYEEFQVIFAIFFFIVYYIGLIFTFNTKSIRIRLAVPYLCPPFVIMRAVFQIPIFASNCARLFNGVSNAITMYPVLIYAITLVRYFYLRNLLSIMSKSNHFKIFKMMASKWFGLLVSLLIPLPTFGLSFLMVIDREIYLTSNMTYFRNSLLGSIIIFGIVVGLSFLIFDMIANRRKIRKKGLYYYFFFDDPFYIKIDLALIFLLLVLTVITFLVYNSQFAIGAVTVAFSLTCFIILGGSAMIIEIYSKLRKLFTKKDDTESKRDKSLESQMEDVHLMKLLRKFAEKEFSIENVMLYEFLKSIENKKASEGNSREMLKSNMMSSDSLSTTDSRNSQAFSTAPMINSSETVSSAFMNFDQVCQIEELYIQSYSKYEINFPNTTKKAFQKWYEEKKHLYGQTPTLNLIPYSELKDILVYELIKNVTDTFSRMEQTVEYQKWLKLTEIQREQELYDF